MEFSRQEYWSGLLYSPPGDLSDPGMEPTSLTCPSSAGATLLPCHLIKINKPKSSHINPASLRGKIVILWIIWLNNDKRMPAVIKVSFNKAGKLVVYEQWKVCLWYHWSPSLERAGYTMWGFWWLLYTLCMLMHTLIIYVNFVWFRCEVPSGHIIRTCCCCCC